jgi:hypothetical protein
VLVGIAVAAVAIFALREPNGHHSAAASKSSGRSTPAAHSPTPSRHSSQSTSSAPATTDSHSGTSVKDVPLIVLNNTTIHGLATQAAIRFEAGGWTVTSSGNLTNTIISTCAYYDPADAHAKRAAEALQVQYPTIKRVQPRFAELPSGPIVVVLTPDYSAG